MHRLITIAFLILAFLAPAAAVADEEDSPAVKAIERAHESTGHQLDVLAKKIDDVVRTCRQLFHRP